MVKKLITILLGVLLFLSFSTSAPIRAQNDQEKLEKLTQEIQQYELEIQKLKNQASSLSNQIAQYDAQIRLTSLKVEQTQEKISLLGGRIDQLEVSLQALTNAFAQRVAYSYKMSRLYEPVAMFLTSNDITSTFASYHYLQKIQKSDRDLLVRLEDAQVAYQDEKQDQEILQKELEAQKKVLGTQKAAKATLLEQTRNDEKKYQQLLSAARSEFEAIQAIIAGKGQEREVGKVSHGSRIASIIQGPSCNSSGEHLHFIVSENAAAKNPFSYLRSGIDYENCSGSSCGSSDGDPFNPSGLWDWPISPRIKYSQGYGSTWAVRNTWVGRVYSFHNGIDIKGGSPEVRAVGSGTLYQGSYSGSSGCRLRYVRVHHDDSGLDTFYLHINY